MNQEKPFLSIKEVIDITGLKESTVRRYAKDEANPFPKSKAISKRNVRWSRKEILEWIEYMECS